MKIALLCFSGVALGFLAWNSTFYGLAALPLVVVLWGRIARSRTEAFASVYSYYLAAAGCQLPSISTYWMSIDGSPAIKEAVIVWLGANAILASIWALIWGRSWISVRLVVILVLISLPPIGVIGWASPLTGAGVWFPWMGWYGLTLFVALLALLAAPGGKGRTASISILAFASLSANWMWPPQPGTAGIGIDTNFGAARDFDGEYGRLVEVDDRIRGILRTGRHPEYILLPEAVGGYWSSSQIVFDQVHRAAARRSVTVLIGAREFDGAGQLVNAVYSIGAGAGHRWTNRVPVPAGLWRPGESDNAATDWWSAGVQTVDGLKVGSLICYEQLLVWPVLFTAAADAEFLIAPSNLWFGVDTSLLRIQRNATSSWGRLFGIPVVFANNS